MKDFNSHLDGAIEDEGYRYQWVGKDTKKISIKWSTVGIITDSSFTFV